MSPTVYPRVGFLGRFGWGGSDFTGSLQNTHAATRMSPRKKLGGVNTVGGSVVLHDAVGFPAIAV